MSNFKDFLKQIKIEIKKILTSKVMIVFLGIVMAFSIIIPILSTMNLFGPRYHYGYGEGDLEVNGVVIEDDNMFYWEIFQAQDTINRLSEQATSNSDDLAIELVTSMLDDYLEISKHVKSHEDYRSNVVWSRREHMMNVFILEHIDIEKEEMQEILEKTNMFYRDPTSLKKEYYDLSDEEKAKKLADSKEALELSDKIILSSDHEAYFGYMTIEAESRLESNKHEIERLEKSIIEEPENEEIFNNQIEDLKKQIKMHDEVTMPILEYRKANDIVPGEEDWRDTALRHKESAMYSIFYNSDVLTQAEFEKDQYLKMEYESYTKYTEAMQKRIDEATNNLMIADMSLDTNKPDMKYVTEGARKKSTQFLYYSLLIAVLGAIIGGGLISREIQTGTVRLLLIRPKSRTKIALAKLFGLLIICFGIYAASILLNIFTNGIIYGFKDLGYPNYTISAGVRGISFFAYLMPKILACTVVVIFSTCFAYFLSIATRNTALSVSIPLVSFAGSLIAMSIVGYSQKYSWIVYTPLPYINMPNVVLGEYYSPTGIEPNIVFGVLVLLGLAAAFVVAGTILFKKRDIRN